MKTITDDLEGFFAQGGWTFLEADSEAEGGGRGGGVDGSDVDEDDYDPDADDSEEEGRKQFNQYERIFHFDGLFFSGSESEYSAEEDDEEDFEEEESDSGWRNSNIRNQYDEFI